METGFLTIIEVSTYLNIKTKNLYAIVESGDVPHYKIGRLIRFKKEEIDNWMEGNRAGRKESGGSSSSSNEEQQKKTKGKRRKTSGRTNDHTNKMVAKIIDSETDKYYSAVYGRSDQIEDLRKEVNNGIV